MTIPREIQQLQDQVTLFVTHSALLQMYIWIAYEKISLQYGSWVAIKQKCGQHIFFWNNDTNLYFILSTSIFWGKEYWVICTTSICGPVLQQRLKNNTGIIGWSLQILCMAFSDLCVWEGGHLYFFFNSSQKNPSRIPYQGNYLVPPCDASSAHWRSLLSFL